MKRKLKAADKKLFRPLPHRMERRMKSGYKDAAAVNLDEAKVNCVSSDIAEYEKWLLTQTDKQAN